jgi:hypothetical protein
VGLLNFAADSNAGTSLLASKWGKFTIEDYKDLLRGAVAVTAYYNNVTQSQLSWPELVAREIFAPLNMTHSFFGALPLDLISSIGVPGGTNWADLIVGLGYDPAAGMWVSYNNSRRRLEWGTDVRCRVLQTI